MVPSASTTLFEATIPSSSLRRLSRILIALSKLSDELSFEADSTKIMLSAINMSKSAFGMINLDAKTFCTSYDCPDSSRRDEVVVRCKMQTRVDPIPLTEGNVLRVVAADPEACQLKVVENIQTGACRFIIRLLCKHGVVKTHPLTYSPTQTLYALSNRNEATQQFVIQSRLAKEYLEHFRSKIEEVDIYVDGDKLVFNGFTEGFTGDDSQLLKQPLQTQVSLSTGELDDFQFQERTHILLPLRDLKAAISLGDSLGVPTHAYYSTPGKPFIISLDRDNPGISCEFVIATSGNGTSSSQSSSVVQTRLNTQIRQPSLQPSLQHQSQPRRRQRSNVPDGEMMVDEGVGWGDDGQMSPARTARSAFAVQEEEDLYGDQGMQMDEEEEVPPTQQERYYGIFDG